MPPRRPPTTGSHARLSLTVPRTLGLMDRALACDDADELETLRVAVEQTYADDAHRRLVLDLIARRMRAARDGEGGTERTGARTLGA